MYRKWAYYRLDFTNSNIIRSYCITTYPGTGANVSVSPFEIFTWGVFLSILFVTSVIVQVVLVAMPVVKTVSIIIIFDLHLLHYKDAVYSKVCLYIFANAT